jgi:hypothetical protein
MTEQLLAYFPSKNEKGVYEITNLSICLSVYLSVRLSLCPLPNNF